MGRRLPIPHRKSSLAPIPPSRLELPIAVALRRSFAQGYTLSRLKHDALAGVVVGIVALPLSMALAIAVGVAPQHGLYTAIVAGAVVALMGGSKHQVTGPTAAFIVILAPITSKYGFSGLLTAGLMAGVLLVAMGALRLGRLIEFIPYPVTTGFTAGIATVIATLQVKDVLGLPIAKQPDGYFEKLGAIWEARQGASLVELGIAAATLALLLLWPRVTRAVPAPLVAIVIVSACVTALSRLLPSLHIATIGSRFHTTIGGHEYAGIPPLPPLPILPWGGHGAMSFAKIRELLSPALAIAVLGAIESLLSAVIADAMTGKKHEPNAELVGLGFGNLVAPFFGGIAATGALARTATNIRAGATSPIAAVVHSFTVLAAVLVAAPLVAYVPMAALAALLLLVAWNMCDINHFTHMVRVAPRHDVAVLLTCFVLTVAFDMVVAIGVGVVLAALLFMKRMSELTSSRVLASCERLRDWGATIFWGSPKGNGCNRHGRRWCSGHRSCPRDGPRHRRDRSGGSGERARKAAACEETRGYRWTFSRASQRFRKGQSRSSARARVSRGLARARRAAGAGSDPSRARRHTNAECLPAARVSFLAGSQA